MAGEITGLQEQLAELAAIVGRVQAQTPQGLARAALFVESTAKALLSLTSHPAGTPTPSQPGQPPSLVSGALRRSITTQGPTLDGDDWVVSVAPTIVYGRIQELGGTAGRGAQLPARPYMAPAWAALPARLQTIMQQAWNEAT